MTGGWEFKGSLKTVKCNAPFTTLKLQDVTKLMMIPDA